MRRPSTNLFHKETMKKLLFLFALASSAFGQQTAIGAASLFIGSGLNDATSGGTFTARAQNSSYDVTICTAATPDTIKFRKNNGMYTSCVAITGSAQAMGDG